MPTHNPSGVGILSNLDQKAALDGTLQTQMRDYLSLETLNTGQLITEAQTANIHLHNTKLNVASTNTLLEEEAKLMNGVKTLWMEFNTNAIAPANYTTVAQWTSFLGVAYGSVKALEKIGSWVKLSIVGTHHLPDNTFSTDVGLVKFIDPDGVFVTAGQDVLALYQTSGAMMILPHLVSAGYGLFRDMSLAGFTSSLYIDVSSLNADYSGGGFLDQAVFSALNVHLKASTALIQNGSVGLLESSHTIWQVERSPDNRLISSLHSSVYNSEMLLVSLNRYALSDGSVVGFTTVQGLSSSTAISLPSLPSGTLGDRHQAKIQAEGGDIKIRFDAQNPTSVVGFTIKNGETLHVKTWLPNVRILAHSGSSTNVHILYLLR